MLVQPIASHGYVGGLCHHHQMLEEPCLCVICTGNRERITPFDRKLLKAIYRNGWTNIDVLEDEEALNWTYTIGLWHRFRHPEIMIFGIEPDVASTALNILGKQVSEGDRILDGQRREDVLANVPVRIATMHETWRTPLFGPRPRGSLYRIYEDTPLPSFLQVIWPDLEGRFVGEDGAADWASTNQPDTSIPHDDHPRGMWTSAYPRRRKRGWTFG